MKFPGAVHSVVPSGLVLYIGITSCTFPPWTEMSKKNGYVYVFSICMCTKIISNKVIRGVLGIAAVSLAV